MNESKQSISGVKTTGSIGVVALAYIRRIQINEFIK